MERYHQRKCRLKAEFHMKQQMERQMKKHIEEFHVEKSQN